MFSLCVSEQTLAQQAEDPEALIHQGIELRRQGDDMRAEGYFKRAYQIAHTARSLAQLGLVELAIGDYMAAELYLTNALAGDDAWIRSYQKTLEDSRLSARGHLMQVIATDAPPGTRAIVEKEPPIDLKLDGVLWLNPGPAVVTFEAAGYRPVTMTVRGTAGTIQRITLGFVKSQAVSDAVGRAAVSGTPPKLESNEHTAVSTSGRHWISIGLGVGLAGAAAVGVGTALLVVGNSRRDDIESAAATGTQRYNPADDDWHSLQRVGTGVLIAGAVAFVGGATLVLVGRRVATTEEQISLVPVLDHGGLAVAGRF